MSRSKLEIFEKGDFREYVERLTFYFIANSIGQVAAGATADQERAADTQKAAVLISQLSAENYSILKSLCLPDKPAQKTFEELGELLSEHFKPNVSVLAATHRFQRICQKDGESATQYAARLKQAAMDCKFQAYLDRALRDQFVSGLKSMSVTKEILSKAKETSSLADIVTMASAYETASRESEQLTAQSVHAVRSRQSTSKPTPTFKSHDKKCFRCDKAGHKPEECRFKSVKCHACGTVGHIERACRKKKSGQTVHHIAEEIGEFVPCASKPDVTMYSVNAMGRLPYTVSLDVMGTTIQMEIDTGSAVTILSSADFLQCNGVLSNLMESSINLVSYSGDVINCLGEAEMEFRMGTQLHTLLVRVTNGNRPSILGRDAMALFKLPWKSIFEVHQVEKSGAKFIEKYPGLFDTSEVGKVKGVQVKLHVSDESPVYRKARPVPLSIRESYVEALNKLEADGIIEKVTHSEWASPTVTVEKSGGGLRICGDYSGTINLHSKCEQYPLPTLEELLHKLGPGSKFTKLDLSQAYHQLEIAPECRKYTTINTMQGLYQYKRLPFGFHSAVSIFQRVMEETLSDLPGCGGYIDDVLCTGRDEEIHEKNVDQVLSCLNEKGFKLNPKKFSYMADKLTYLGHQVTAQGIAPSPDRVNALKVAKPPNNVNELYSFLGAANFQRKFVPRFAEIAAPLYNLLRKEMKWQWSKAEEDAFQALKDAMCEHTLLAHYDVKKPVTLQVDASPMGLGAVLLQRQKNGDVLPVAYVSRKLTPAESRYAQIEREAVAVVFGVTKFQKYLLGRHFTLQTDHQPLLKLLGNNEPVPTLASARIKKWALMLAGYDYEIKYLPGKENVYADFLSRQPCENISPSAEEMVTVRVLLVEEDTIIKADVVKSETARDPELSKVLYYVVNGWPSSVPQSFRSYHNKRDELSAEDGILLWGQRVVIPKSLRMVLLRDLHTEHFGMVKTKQMARRYLWWPNVDQEIEMLIKACAQCQESAKCPPAKSGTWSWPNGPWKRVHIDFAGPFMGKMFLVVVDAYTKYLDVIAMSNATSATTIAALRHVFSVFGLPEHLVSDNGTQFTSEEFKAFLRANDIVHTLTAPGHPATNGLAERYVGVFKQKLKEMGATSEPLQARLDRFLLTYRTTPNHAGRTPAEMMFGRQPRTRLSALRPSQVRQQAKAYEDGNRVKPAFTESDSVFALNFGKGNRWVPGRIVRVLSDYNYEVQVGDVLWKRHRDQLRLRSVPASLSASLPEPLLDTIDQTSPSPVLSDVAESSLASDFPASVSPQSATVQVEADPPCEQSAPEVGLPQVENTPCETTVRRSSRRSVRPDRLIEQL
ncbi:uncharacterized protein K02A2.6-like [Sycon ciliatum]|uniref:uncharacterized protein K02A2.6-like n=1 Tax=Sycon ciliatum TaxID=27933 RepID=UPI0031F68591